MAIPADTPSPAPVRKQEHGHFNAGPPAGTLIFRYSENDRDDARGDVLLRSMGAITLPSALQARRGFLTAQ